MSVPGRAAARNDWDAERPQELEVLGHAALAARIIVGDEIVVADFAHPSGALGFGGGVDAEGPPGHVVPREALAVGVEKANVGDETVMVEVQEVPNVKQRCYEVAYGRQKGYLCVWAGGTPESKYGYTRSFDPENVTEQGWTSTLGC